MPRRASWQHRAASRTCPLVCVHGTVAVVGVAITMAVLLAPDGPPGLRSPELRLVVEMSGLFLAAIAALVLALTDRADLGPARDAFIAALSVLAVTNAVFTVAPAVLDLPASIDRGLAVYPWVVSRFVAGALMVAAVLDRPKLGLPRTLAVAFATLLALDLALIAASTRLPPPVVLGSDGAFEVSSVGGLTAMMLVPAALFVVGSWSAARLYARGAAPLYAWLSIAMAIQVFSHLHGLVAPAFLGPTVTTMDLFRTGSWVLLAGGAIAQLHHLYVTRSATAAQQAQDLHEQTHLLAAQQRLAEREHDFRAVVSHELATPIAAVRAFAHVLSSPSADPRQREHALTGLRGEVSRLAELVDRIDELQDLDGAELTCHLRPVAIRPLLEEIRAFGSGLPGRSDVILRCADDRAAADPVRLGQLLRNLIGNAARYSPEGEPIVLHGAIVDAHRYRIDVVDRGPGIPVEERQRLLQPYARGSGADGSSGSGLGLYIAHRLAEAHGGALAIGDGEQGRGTTVSVMLQRAT